MKEEPHFWKLRVVLTISLLLFALIGLVLTDISSTWGWHYWRVMVPVYAIFSISLSAYLRSKKEREPKSALWQDITMWAVSLLSIYVVSIYVHIGMMGRFNAALQVLTLLALTTCMAGIFIELTFLPLGIVLGGFAVAAAFAEVYLYSIVIPFTVIAIIAMIFLFRPRKKNILK
jgi:hypothetical protein